MDRALWFLLWLRFTGWARRLSKSLFTLKGAGLAALGLFVFVPMIISAFLSDAGSDAERLAQIRRYGPLVMLSYCLMTVMFSSAERAVTFSPAEVNFLFTGPFSRRQLLIYKIVSSLGAIILTATLLSVFLKKNAAMFLAAYVGLVLALVF